MQTTRFARDGSSGPWTELRNRFETAYFGVDRGGVNDLEYRRVSNHSSRKSDAPGAAEKSSGRAKTARIQPTRSNGPKLKLFCATSS